MPEKKSQRQVLLEYLMTHDSITSMQAFEMFGITRISSVIFDLRKAGHNILTEEIDGENRYGTKVTYGKYSLDASEKQKNTNQKTLF